MHDQHAVGARSKGCAIRNRKCAKDGKATEQEAPRSGNWVTKKTKKELWEKKIIEIERTMGQKPPPTLEGKHDESGPRINLDPNTFKYWERRRKEKGGETKNGAHEAGLGVGGNRDGEITDYLKTGGLYILPKGTTGGREKHAQPDTSKRRKKRGKKRKGAKESKKSAKKREVPLWRTQTQGDARCAGGGNGKRRILLHSRALHQTLRGAIPLEPRRTKKEKRTEGGKKIPGPGPDLQPWGNRTRGTQPIK